MNEWIRCRHSKQLQFELKGTMIMNPAQQIFWQTTVNMPDDSNPLPLPDKVDVAIIGGGFTGLSAARALAKRGVKVAVLEANTIGWGASSRNGGMVLTGLKISMGTIFKKYGRDMARRLFQCSLDSINTVEQIIKEENINCGFKRTGHLLTANKPKHYDEMARSAEFMDKEFGHTLQLIPRDEQRREIGTDLYYGALLDTVSAGLNPAQYVTGLALAAQKAGASLHARTRVDRLERGTNGWSLDTERGKLHADKVFVATSGYTNQATSKLQRKIIPIGSFIIATEKLSDSLASEISPNNRMIFDYKHYLHYFRLWDNRLIFGGRAAFFPENKNTIRQSAEILRKDMIQVYPQLKEVKIEYVWGGTLDFAFDMMTHVGELDGLYYSLGYAGHGVAMATYLGKTSAEAMLDGSIKDHPFAQFSFPNAPLGLYDGRPWFLPLVGMWHRMLDWVE
jgi:glycine/D-amino acid oxidase-like deaminating enzyme